MTTPLARLAASCALSLPVVFLSPAADAQTYAQFKGHKLPMIQRSVLADVEGRLGHLVFDPVSGRTFVAAQRSNSLEALDPSGFRTAQSIKDLPGPSGVVLMPDSRRLAVACGDGAVHVFTLNEKGELAPQRVIQLRGEADQLVYDQKAQALFVAHGKFVSRIDPNKDTDGTRAELPDFPEGLAIDPDSNRLFVNIAKRGEIVVLNRDDMKILTTWTLKDVKANYPMSLDVKNQRLMVATQEPAKFIALDTKDGREVARLDIPAGAEDMWYDAPGTRCYISCGGSGGKVAIVLQSDPNTYTVDHQEGTMAGAATSVLVPERRRLIVTAPKMADQPTFVYIFLIPP